MTRTGINAILALTALLAPATAAAELEVNHLGVTNTLVRVKADSTYLILPVQESIDDARINVLVDGKIADTFYVRMAKSKTDYEVPFDLTPYKGKEIVLDIVTPQGRSSVREAKEDVCWKGIRLADTFDTSDREKKYRPLYHHTPLYGWMNDPNGMFYKDGVWHLYYQYNPYGSKWQNMTWGHSTSDDLINWHHEDEAIRPDGLGAIFSGSCVVDTAGTAGYGRDAVVALYTSAATNQMQSLAYSLDNGKTFTKLSSNPVITLESEARDPNMFWNEETKEWNLALAHALDREMLFFTSPDLKHWTLQSSFGKGLGAQGGVWECPDLFPIKMADTGETKWILICNINPDGPFGGSGVQYFIGDWDGKTFTADKDSDGKINTKWLDYGKDNYALVSWSGAPDGRRTVIGWMSNWQYAADVPTTQYRSANTLPREIGIFRAPDGNLYASSAPSPELLSLRGKTVASGKGNIGKAVKSFKLPTTNDGACEITAEIDARKGGNVSFTLSNALGEKVTMIYDTAAHTMSFDRRNSGVTSFSENFPAVTAAPTRENNGKITLRIFIDRSSIELFGNDGQFVMTNLVFPNQPYSQLSVKADGGTARLENLKVYSLSLK